MSFFFKTELKDFQKETVDWMKQMEKKYGGGLLLNEPGTGKSLCCLSLTESNEKILIVCPAGVIDNWIAEIHKHSQETPNIIKYHGSRREYKNNINTTFIITSYSILANEWKAEHSFLNNHFDRIILDEAHYIRNKSNSYFKSCKSLKGTFKWIVTATPIFNKKKDLYAYFDFLEIPVGICRRKDNILGELRELRELVKRYSICKTKKELKIIKPKQEKIIKINFNDHELEFYTAFRDYSSVRLNLLYKKMKMTTNSQLRGVLTSNLLLYILRLKQCCNHPLLVIRSLERLAKTTSIKKATEVLKFYNTNKMVEEDCPVCYERCSDTILECGHKFCNQCITQMTDMNHNNCPMCRKNLIIKETIQKNPCLTIKDSIVDNIIEDSSKIKKLIQIVKNSKKIVVVSQWTSMLDLVKESDELKNYSSVDLRGGMTINEKTEAIRKFKENPNVKICYLSLTSSAEGIDLTVANKMIFLDTWWNDAKMIQASDRIHRIGQTKNVQIYILQMQGTLLSAQPCSGYKDALPSNDNIADIDKGVINTIEEDIYKMAKSKGQLSNLLTKTWKGRRYEVSIIENMMKSLKLEIKKENL